VLSQVSGRSSGPNKRRKSEPEGKGKSWVFRKKEQMRSRGYDNIPVDTKYTGRKRKPGF
jgi:18S rRNA (guanine1575-N7)-methyltransferase